MLRVFSSSCTVSAYSACSSSSRCLWSVGGQNRAVTLPCQLFFYYDVWKTCYSYSVWGSSANWWFNAGIMVRAVRAFAANWYTSAQALINPMCAQAQSQWTGIPTGMSTQWYIHTQRHTHTGVPIFTQAHPHPHRHAYIHTSTPAATHTSTPPYLHSHPHLNRYTHIHT